MRSKSGFTLVELLAVMAIMLIMSGVAVASYINMTRGAAMRSAIRHLQGDLTLARQHAVLNNTEAGVVFLDGRSWVVVERKGIVTDSVGTIMGDRWATELVPAGVIVNMDTCKAGKINHAEVAKIDGFDAVTYNTDVNWGIDDGYGIPIRETGYFARGINVTNMVDQAVIFKPDGSVAKKFEITICEQINPSYKPKVIVTCPTGFIKVKNK